MRVLSLNVNRAGGERVVRQVRALAARGPDIVALQEVALRHRAAYRQALHAAGYPYVLDSIGEPTALHTGRRSVGVLTASTWQCAPLAHAMPGLPWPERLLSVTIATPWGEVEVHNVYVPLTYGDTDAGVKVQTLNALFTGLSNTTHPRRILCGDFNAPQGETEAGELITFGQTRRRSGLFAITHAAAHASEGRIFRDLAAHDLADVYRALHGYARQEISWLHAPSQRGFRLDHLFASRALNPVACAYLHDFRTADAAAYGGMTWSRLSDHAAIEAVFSPCLLPTQ